jgi:iron(III) transport system permease protein
MRWLGKKSYVTVTGKSDAGLAAPLPPILKIAVLAVVLPWVLFTLAVYVIMLAGGFVTDIGRWDLTPTFGHLVTAFSFEIGRDGAGALRLGLGLDDHDALGLGAGGAADHHRSAS